jgi:hypothetical protein
MCGYEVNYSRHFGCEVALSYSWPKLLLLLKPSLLIIPQTTILRSVLEIGTELYNQNSRYQHNCHTYRNPCLVTNYMNWKVPLGWRAPHHCIRETRAMSRGNRWRRSCASGREETMPTTWPVVLSPQNSSLHNCSVASFIQKIYTKT